MRIKALIIACICLLLSACSNITERNDSFTDSEEIIESAEGVTFGASSEAEQSGMTSMDESEQNVSDDESSAEPVGGHDGCEHFEHYHFISYTFMQYVGVERAYEWINSFEDPGDCDKNMFEFIKYFNIPREDFESIYNEKEFYYTTYYNIDILYSGDRKLADEHYDIYWKQISVEMRARSLERHIKKKLINEYDKNNYKNLRITQWSIAEFVYENDVSREELEEVIEYYYKANKFDKYYYDLDKIYSRDKTLLDAINSKEILYGFQIDEMIRIKKDKAN